MASVELSFFGQKTVLKSSNVDPELVQRTLGLVTQRIEQAQTRAKGAAPHQVTLLALMDLAAEYLMAKDRTEEFKKDIHEKSLWIQGWIDAESNSKQNSLPNSLESQELGS